MIVRKYSNVCDTCGVEAEFETTEDLLAIDWVKRCSDAPDFYRFSVSPAYHLIAEYFKGRQWLKVAYLPSTAKLDLPQFYPCKKSKLMNAEEIISFEVKDDSSVVPNYVLTFRAYTHGRVDLELDQKQADRLLEKMAIVRKHEGERDGVKGTNGPSCDPGIKVTGNELVEGVETMLRLKQEKENFAKEAKSAQDHFEEAISAEYESIIDVKKTISTEGDYYVITSKGMLKMWIKEGQLMTEEIKPVS